MKVPIVTVHFEGGEITEAEWDKLAERLKAAWREQWRAGAEWAAQLAVDTGAIYPLPDQDPGEFGSFAVLVRQEITRDHAGPQ